MKVCIGGTFNIFHKGHKKLVDKAFEIAEKNGFVFIGIATNKLIKNKENVKPFSKRKDNIISYIKKKGFSSQVLIEPIRDLYGPTVVWDFDCIVVSPETRENAILINKKRMLFGKKPLEIVVIPFVLADDGKPISSSRIKKDIIDKKGHMVRSG